MWICSSRANPFIIKTADRDESDDTYRCELVDTLENVARISYYTLKLVRGLP